MVENKTTLNDQEMMNDILTSVKHLQNLQNTLNIESSTDQLTSKGVSHYSNLSKLQRKVFNLMSELGYYKIEIDEKTKITQAITKFEQMAKELPYTVQ